MFPAPFQNLRVSYVNEIYSWYCRVQYIIIDCQSGNEGLRRVRYSSCEELAVFSFLDMGNSAGYAAIQNYFWRLFPPFSNRSFSKILPGHYEFFDSTNMGTEYVNNGYRRIIYKNNNQIF